MDKELTRQPPCCWVQCSFFPQTLKQKAKGFAFAKVKPNCLKTLCIRVDTGVWTGVAEIPWGGGGPQRRSLEHPTTDPSALEEVFPFWMLAWNVTLFPGTTGLCLGALEQWLRGTLTFEKQVKIVQGPDLAPGAFLERLYQIYCLYSALDTEAPGHTKYPNS